MPDEPTFVPGPSRGEPQPPAPTGDTPPGGTPPAEPSAPPAPPAGTDDAAFYKEQLEASNARYAQLMNQWEQIMQQLQPPAPASTPSPGTGLPKFTEEQLKGYDPLAVAIYQQMDKLMEAVGGIAEYQESMRTSARDQLTQEETNRVLGQFGSYTSEQFKAAGLPAEGHFGGVLTRMVYDEMERAYNAGQPLTRGLLDRTIQNVVAELRTHFTPRPSTPPRTPGGGGPSPDPNKRLNAQERRAAVAAALSSIFTAE